MDRGNGNNQTVSAVAVDHPGPVNAVEVHLVGVQAADPNIEGDAIRDDFI